MTNKDRLKLLEDFRVTIKNIITLMKDGSIDLLLEDVNLKREILKKMSRLVNGAHKILLLPNPPIKLCNELEDAYAYLDLLLNSGLGDEHIGQREIKDAIDRLIYITNKLENEFIENRNYNLNNIDQEIVYNSMQFYEDRIASIDNERRKLEETIDQLVEENQQSQSQKEELELKKKELTDAASLIEFYQKELELRKKQDDAVNEWKTKIETTFKKLKEYLLPIENEHNRLKEMFVIYKCLAATIVLALIGLEIISCCKIYNAVDFPDFKNYIVLFIPVPIAGGLLWAFICQMNRAQRQMVILSRYKHEIQYVEGLLVSINSLSPSIDEAVKRINLALDRMIDNHLSIGTKDVFTEDRFLKEEKKDGMPYDVVMNILGAFKDVVKKS